MLKRSKRSSAIAAGVLMLACGQREPAVPKHVLAEICSGRHIDSATRAQHGGLGYTLADLGPEFLSQSVPLAKTASKRGEPVVIPALPPLGNEQAIIPALPAAGAMPVKATSSSHVLLQNGKDLLAIDPRVSPYRVTVPEICVGNFIGASLLQICVSDTGNVTGVDILEPSVWWLDRQIPEVIGRWKFRPFLLNGRAQPFCFTTRYAGDVRD
jgi:hypothetical protein